MTLSDLRSEVARERGWHEDDDGDRIDEVLNERFAPHALELYEALEDISAILRGRVHSTPLIAAIATAEVTLAKARGES